MASKSIPRPVIGSSNRSTAESLDGDDSRSFPALEIGLRAALDGEPWACGIKLTSVTKNPYACSWTTELLSCDTAGGPMRIFCKRSQSTSTHVAQYTGGLGYEHAVYQKILSRSSLSQPRYFGSFLGPDGNYRLFIESLEGYSRWSRTGAPEESALKVARWLGRFHAEQESCLSETPQTLAWLRQHDEDYFRLWIEHVRRFSMRSDGDFRWLEPLCERALELLPDFLATPRTVIHGEFFPQNVLVRDDDVRPVDWEAAAVGAGEEDLVTMIDNWPAPMVAACEREYAAARWPSGAPDHFQTSLLTAHLLHQFRWLGDNDVRDSSKSLWRCQAIREAAFRLNSPPGLPSRRAGEDYP
jgi:hypothetical protein